jgi:hypothetical protein
MDLKGSCVVKSSDMERENRVLLGSRDAFYLYQEESHSALVQPGRFLSEEFEITLLVYTASEPVLRRSDM